MPTENNALARATPSDRGPAHDGRSDAERLWEVRAAYRHEPDAVGTDPTRYGVWEVGGRSTDF